MWHLHAAHSSGVFDSFQQPDPPPGLMEAASGAGMYCLHLALLPAAQPPNTIVPGGRRSGRQGPGRFAQ